MIISHSKKFVLFCNPGTGTGPLLRLLAAEAEEEVVEWRHRTAERPFYHVMSPAEAETAFAGRGWDFAAYRRITLVMNPFTRLQALYRRVADTDKSWQSREVKGRPAFCDWVRSTRPDGRGAGGRESERWRRFGSWSAEVWCGDRITDAARTEAQEAELRPVLAALGIAVDTWPDLPPHPGRAWPTTYDQPTAMLVARRYAGDLARFGYDHPVLEWAA